MDEHNPTVKILETEDFDTMEDELRHLKRFIMYVRELTHLRIFKKESIEFSMKDNEESKGSMWDGVKILSGFIKTKFLYNHESDVQDQTVKIIALSIAPHDSARVDNLIKNFEWMFMYNPLYLNFYGVCIDQLLEKSRLYIICEDFKTIGLKSFFN